MDGSQFQYCFSKSNPNCNPFARPKIENGQCVCTAPYIGTQCEQCQPGSKQTTKSYQAHKHTHCDLSDNEAFCNGNGVYTQSKTCICDSIHTGENCQLCVNPDFAYPDCSGDYKSQSTSSLSLHSAEKQRRQKMRTQNPQLISEFLYQCKTADFPQTLNSIQLHQEFKSGNFHTTGLFTVNHNQDNVISFKPLNTGRFKIFVKQPELFELQTQQDTFDIEVGIFNTFTSQMIAQQTNHAINFGSLGEQLTDYSTVSLDVTQAQVNQELLIFFRATNYTHSENAECQVMYIEIEFRSSDTLPSCLYDSQFQMRQTKIQQINPGQEFSIILAAGQILNEEYVYIQDYFVALEGAEIIAGLEQKFIDRSTFVPLFELIATEIQFEDFSFNTYPVMQSPDCYEGCQAIGLRTFNKFKLTDQASKGSVFRLWLVKNQTSQKEPDCWKLKITVTARMPFIKEDLKLSQAQDRCDLSPTLPLNLNCIGYLGVSTQGQFQHDFSYHEQVKMDMSQSEFVTKFQLLENTMVLINGQKHARIDYMLQVLQGANVLASSVDKATELNVPAFIVPTVYTVLQPGNYQIKLIIKQQHQRSHCDQIKLGVSMKKMSTFLAEGKITLRNQLDFLSLTKSIVQNYQYNLMNGNGYQLLMRQEFTFEDRAGMHLLFQVTQAEKITFALWDMTNNRVYMPEQISSQAQSIYLQNVPAHKFQLLVFSRNFEGSLNSDAIQSFDANLGVFTYEQTQASVYWSSTNDTNRRSLELKSTTPSALNCLARSQKVPSQVKANQYLKLMIDSDFGSPKLIYRPKKGDDVLKVQFESGFEMEIFEDGNPIRRSVTSSNSLFSELVVFGLKPNKEYILQLNSNQRPLHEYLWAEECRVVTLTTIAYNSVQIEEGCQSNYATSSDIVLPQNGKTKTQLKSLVSHNLNLSVKSDLEIIIELAQSINTPIMHLQKQQKGAKWIQKNKVQAILDQGQFLNVEEQTFLHQLIIRYQDLKPGNYSLVIEVPNIHELCQTEEFEVQMKTTSLNSPQTTQLVQRYQSKLEDYGSIIPVSSVLPLDLGSLQFLGDESQQQMLYSDLIQLNEDPNKNTISVPILNDGTLMRIYLEDDDLLLDHTFGNEKQGYSLRQSFSKKLQKGLHTIKISHQAGKVLSPNLYAEITISIMDPSQQQSYQSFHQKALTECKQSEMPLALENLKQYTAHESQTIISYPFLRLPQHDFIELNSIPSTMTVMTYYFRFNETQRAFFQAGSNFVTSHLTLTFSGIGKEATTSVYGKQIGNTNVIDSQYPAGDYSLKVTLHSSIVDTCGVFSFKGMLNPLSAMMLEQDGDPLLSGSSNCPVKGDTLPGIIYSSSQKTRNGNEDVILLDGSFIKFFDDVLVERREWLHEIEIEVPSKAMVQITLIGDQIQRYQVQLFSGYNLEQESLKSSVAKTSAGTISELSITWLLEPYRLYHLQISHRRQSKNDEQCNYFDFALSITTFNFLKSKHACQPKLPRLLDVLPASITQQDLPFTLSQIVQIEYPKDFEAMQGLSIEEIDKSSSLVIDSLVQSDTSVHISAKLFQNQGLSDFYVDLFEYPKDLDSPYESMISLSVQTPLIVDLQNSQLVRSLPKTTIRPKSKTLFLLQDKNMVFIFDKIISLQAKDELYQSTLCAQIGITVQIEPIAQVASSQSQVQRAPTIKGFQFVGEVATGNSDISRFGQVPTTIHIEMSEYDSNQYDKKQLALQLKQEVILQLTLNDETVLQFSPESSEITEHGAILVYRPNLDAIKQEIELTSDKWIVKLGFQQQRVGGIPVQQAPEFVKQRMEDFILLKPTRTQQMNNEMQQKSHSPVVTSPDQASIANKVECKCVHGTCNAGESTCNKCFDGWVGVLCDLPKWKNSGPVAHISDDDEIFKVHQINDAHVNPIEKVTKFEKTISTIAKLDSSTKKEEKKKVAKETKWKTQADQLEDSVVVHLLVHPLQVMQVFFSLTLSSLGLLFKALCIVVLVLLLNWIKNRAFAKVTDQKTRRNRSVKRDEYAGIDSIDEDDERLPFDNNLVNRKYKHKSAGGLDFSEDDEDQIELTLFDQADPSHSDKQLASQKKIQTQIDNTLDYDIL